MFRIAFWNLGLQKARLDGKNAKTHLRNLAEQCAGVWWTHDLEALHLCEMGDRMRGLGHTYITNALDAITEKSRTRSRHAILVPRLSANISRLIAFWSTQASCSWCATRSCRARGVPAIATVWNGVCNGQAMHAAVPSASSTFI